MTATAFICSEIFDGHQSHHNAALIVEAGRIAGIRPAAEASSDERREDLGDGLVVPGLVDLQVNGGGGVLFNNDPTPDCILTISNAHARCGTTSILPTLVSDTPEKTRAAEKAAKTCLDRDILGVLGLHLEGPHLSVARKGAHNPDFIRAMTGADEDMLMRLAAEVPTLLITIAPESVSAKQISRLSEAGTILSLGHSDCSYATAQKAARSGAKAVTHLFNAMSQLGSREPGLVGAALGTGSLSVGLIADGFHSDPASIGIALRAKMAPGKIFLVSDAMATTGSDIKGFELNGRKILRSDGRLTLADGTLAGADIDLLSAVRFMVDKVGTKTNEALRMASLYPAQLIGRASEIGTLDAGSQADFLLLSHDLRLKRVWRRGLPV